MEGTVTIPTGEYNMLMEMKRAIYKRQVFYVSHNYGSQVYYAKPKHALVKDFAEQVEKLNDAIYKKDVIIQELQDKANKPKKKGWLI